MDDVNGKPKIIGIIVMSVIFALLTFLAWMPWRNTLICEKILDSGDPFPKLFFSGCDTKRQQN
jgi:hypothetical protein